MRFSKGERETIASFLKKTAIMRKHDRKFRVIGFPALFRLASSEERVLLKKFLQLDPRAYGFKGAHYGITVSPKDLVMIRKERIPKTNKYFSNGAHFLPRKAHEAYQKMHRAMFDDIGSRVFVLSGYRSPAYQLVVFLELFEKEEFDLKKIAKSVALPGYSEHGVSKRQAIDFTTLKLGAKGTDDPSFARTKEYHWLMKRAREFGFHLSYPRRNTEGVMFEPWHWHHEASATVHGKGSGKL